MHNGGSNLGIKVVSSDLPFALEINFSSTTLGKAYNLFFSSVIMPFINANIQKFLENDVFNKKVEMREPVKHEIDTDYV
tara:strand:+ start:1457 stop:1693 length:237 start_codon:yes stop_codon:yes gene_type:complete